MQEVTELDKRVTVVESKQDHYSARLFKVEAEIETLEKSMVQSINDIKIILASARGSVLVIMFIAPFLFAALSFVTQTLINKMFN